MQILWDNKILTATLTRSTENPTYPIENIQDTKLSKWFRTLDGISEYIQVEGPIKASRCAIMSHNLTETATIKIQGNNTTDFSSPTFEQTLTWKSGIIVGKFTEATYNYWRFTFDDSDSGADGYIQIGSLFLGTYLQLPGMKIDQIISDETTANSTVSTGGQLYGDDGYNFRNPTINFSSMTHSQREGIREMWSTVKNIRPFVMVIWADREDIETPIYCAIDQNNIQWRKSENYNVPWQTSIKFRECF